MFDDRDDMILPEGFDPALGDDNFTENGELVDTPIPTTEDGGYNYDEDEDEGQGDYEAEQTIATEEEVVEEPIVPQTLKVRFNHEDRELTMDEAAVFAQKGMNFDKVEMKSKQQEAMLSKYEDMAKMFGYDSAEAMMTQAEQNYVDSKVRDLIDQGNSEAIARFLVNQEMEKAKANRPQATPQSQSGGLTTEQREEIREFAQAYPGLTKIPDEVFKLHKQGLRLTTAYEMYQRQQTLVKENTAAKAAQQELAIIKQNQAAAARGPVTGTIGKASPDKPEATDWFIKGFDYDI